MDTSRPSTARVRYHAWPFRLLEFRKEGGGAQAIVSEFLASRPCCLDEGFSTPLLEKLRLAADPVAELMDPEVQALLLQLRRNLVKATNMELESMLARVKSSAPYSKRAPLSEKVVYMSFLNELMRDHVGRGRADRRGQESRTTLLQRGVPLRQIPTVKSSRDDIRWRFVMFNRWKALHPSASRDDETQELQALVARWTSMPDSQRADEISRLPVQWRVPERESGELADEESAPPQGFAAETVGPDEVFDCGDSDWPVRAEVVRSFLDKEVGRASVAGVARKSIEVRQQAVSGMIVYDQDDIPDSRRYSIRLSCSEMHPGICAWADRAIYWDALKLARNFEVCFGQEKLHKFARLSDPSKDALVFQIEIPH